jgi:hypothetical protein
MRGVGEKLLAVLHRKLHVSNLAPPVMFRLENETYRGQRSTGEITAMYKSEKIKVFPTLM